MAFANRLTEIRKSRNLTQQELAEKVGVGISQMRRYEKGSSSPTLVIKNLAITLGVSTDELIFDNSERVAASRILDKELLRQFETVSSLTARDIDAVKTVLESIIIKNRIEEILEADPFTTVLRDKLQPPSIALISLGIRGQVIESVGEFR